MRAATTASLRPRLGEREAAAVAAELYGLSGAARPLPSERDQNFLLATAAGERFILKVARAGERREELELQDEALDWVARRDPAIAIPRVRPALDGSAITEVRAADGTGHLVRLFTYVPGTLLADARPQPPELLRSLGRLLGSLDRALQGFSHPAAIDRDLDWDPRRAPLVVARARHAIRDDAHRALVDAFVQLYDAAAPKLASLRTSVIHNDANDHNVLVGPPAAEGREVTGLLDFGDMVHSWTVSELAVAIAYAMLDEPDPLAAAAEVVAGYHSALPLLEAEIEVVFPLACIRLCTSVCLSAERRGDEPDNEYLTISEAPAWRALAALHGVHPRLAHYVLRQACGLPASATTPAVVRWLEDHGGEVGPVVTADLAGGLVLDLGVGSPLHDLSADADDTTALGARISAAMAASRAEVAIGRYGEARLLYTTEAYADDGGERRTIHLGIDLFRAAGSPVHTPLAGRVHSFRNNAARLDYGPTLILEHDPQDGPRFFTLYGHLSEDSLFGLRVGAAVNRGQVIGRVGAPPANGDWPPHVHFQIVTDLLDKEGDFPGVAAAGRRGVWMSLSPDPNLVLRIPTSHLRGAHEARAPESLRAERRERLGGNLSLAYRKPLAIVRGYGVHLFDQYGRAYLDVVNNVAHVGHCHPRVVREGQQQMAILNTNTRYLHEAIVEYARRLGETLPEPLRVCFFVNSGSEANELALRLARAHTRGRGVVVVDGAYHGNTTGLVEVSPYKFDGPGGEGAPAHVRKVPMPDDYRGLYRRDDAARAERFAAHVGAAMEETREGGGRPAAFLCESLLSVGGQIVPPPGFLAAAYRLARAAGAVCIADEVQVGLGRVGTHFWGFEAQGAVPDIVTMGKPIGNGHPLGAVVTTAEIAASFANGMEYFNTFGGNPVSCAVGLAVLDVIRDERLQERALRVGARLKAGLEGLAERHRVIGDVRGLGLFLGIELVRDPESREPAAEKASYVVERARGLGVLLSTDGPDHNVVKMKPPLVFSETDADRVVAVLEEVLGDDFVRRT